MSLDVYPSGTCLYVRVVATRPLQLSLMAYQQAYSVGSRTATPPRPTRTRQRSTPAGRGGGGGGGGSFSASD